MAILHSLCGAQDGTVSYEYADFTLQLILEYCTCSLASSIVIYRSSLQDQLFNWPGWIDYLTTWTSHVHADGLESLQNQIVLLILLLWL